jgi:hypothetical protein
MTEPVIIEAETEAGPVLIRFRAEEFVEWCHAIAGKPTPKMLDDL